METLHEYKCPCCGGAITFDSSLQKMKCPYCETEFDVDAFKAYDDKAQTEADESEMNWEKTPDNGTWSEADNMYQYVCKSCGGTILGDDTLAATSCPYCGNPVVIMGQFSGELKPDYVIPFAKKKEDAKAAYINHLKNKKLLPNMFFEENHIDEIKGIYIPFWLFNADVDADFHFKCTRVRSWSTYDYYYTETSYYSVERGGTMVFERVPVDGSSKMPDDLMESIEPFVFKDAVPFQPAYLAGYIAEKYDVSEEANVPRANARIGVSAEATFRSTVGGYNSIVLENKKIHFDNGKALYALYPVWLLSTTYKDKNYLFAMNGQTGKLVGDLPVDWGKFWRYFMIYGVIFTILALVIIILVLGR